MSWLAVDERGCWIAWATSHDFTDLYEEDCVDAYAMCDTEYSDSAIAWYAIESLKFVHEFSSAYMLRIWSLRLVSSFTSPLRRPTVPTSIDQPAWNPDLETHPFSFLYSQIHLSATRIMPPMIWRRRPFIPAVRGLILADCSYAMFDEGNVLLLSGHESSGLYSSVSFADS